MMTREEKRCPTCWHERPVIYIEGEAHLMCPACQVTTRVEISEDGPLVPRYEREEPTEWR